MLSRLLSAFKPSENIIQSKAESCDCFTTLRVLIVGEPRSGKSYFLRKLVGSRKVVLCSKVSNEIKAVKKLATISMDKIVKAQGEVLIIEDLPAFKNLGDLMRVLSIHKHLGLNEVFVTTQFIGFVEVDTFKTLTHLVVFKSDLPVQKLSALLNNNYQLAQKIANKASTLQRFQYFIVEKATGKISTAYVNDNANSFRSWVRNPVDEVAREAKQTVVVESYEGMSIRQQILALKRRDQSLDHYQIAQALNIGVNHAKKELSRLRRCGLIE